MTTSGTRLSFFLCEEGIKGMAENRANTGRFVAGQSGNPRGRPKIPQDVKDAIRGACPEAVRVLIAMLSSRKEAYRLEAAKTLLDRGYGKPVQMQDVALDVSGGLDVRGQIRDVLLERMMRERETVG